MKTAYGAKGDGITDDTNALQAALNDVGNSGRADVVYLPSGTYKISATLYIATRENISFVGQDPSTTIIKWAGPSGGTMFWADGVAYSKWARITWDGSNTAAIDFTHKWNTSHGYSAQSLRHEDEVFKNAQKCFVGGAMGSGYGQNDSEVSIIRSTFANCSTAGLSTESWNALDYWIWDSQFINNARGVTNQYGAGNFSVYRSIFQNSSVADITIGSKSNYVFRGNTSSGSNQFLYESNIGQNASQITIQGNKILATANTIAVDVGSLGALALIDNQIQSPSGATGPAIRMSTWGNGGDLISIGNQYTVSNPIQVSTGGTPRWWTQGDQTVSYSNISSTLPKLPGTSPNLNRTIFEVPAGNASGIQSAINQAGAFCGQRPVVHLPKATYSIGQTIAVPACDMQIVGDGWGTVINWTGASGGNAIDLAGPSKVILKEIALNGPSTSVTVEGSDQQGARVYADEFQPQHCSQYCALADSLTYTLTELHGTNGWADSGTVFKSAGANGSGTSMLAQFGGMNSMWSTSAQALYSVSGGGRMLIEDAWYEGQGSQGFNLSNDSGTFTWWSGRFAPYSNAPSTPSFTLNQFNGSVLLGNVFEDLTQSSVYRPFTISNETSQTNVLILGNDSSESNFFNRTGSGGTATYIENKTFNPSTGDWQDADQGNARTATFITNLLNQLRTTAPQYTADLPAGVTDVRLLRVLTAYPVTGLHVKGGGTTVTAAAPPSITSTSPLPAGVVGTAYTYTLTAGGSTPIAWSTTSGALPAGLLLNASTGVISGTPSAAGVSTFTVQASNSAGSSSQSFSLTVNPGTTGPSITTTGLPGGIVGIAYSATLAASGTTPITWALASGSLPSGLSLNSSTGVISGTPASAGTSSFTVSATNANGTSTQSLSLKVSYDPYAYWKLNDGTGTTAADSSGDSRTAQLVNSPAWTTGTNCESSACLSFNGSSQYGTVALDLSDTAVVTLAFWMNWSAYANDDRLAFEFSPNFNSVATGFMVDPNSSAAGGGQFEVGLMGNAGYNQVVFARPAAGWHHYAFIFNKAASAANEVIPYVDGVAVPYTKTTSAANSNNFASDTLFFMSRGGSGLFGAGALDEVRVYKRALGGSEIQALASAATAPVITSTSPLTSGTQNQAYSYQFTASGTTPMSWSVAGGALPAGLNLSSSGLLSGTPTQSGTFTFTVQASNSAGANTAPFSLAINSPVQAPTVTSVSPLNPGTQNQAYSYQFTANGTTPISWSLASGALPAGLNLSSSGLLSGTPTQSGTFTFTVQASNSAGANTAQFSLAINPNGQAPAITSTSPLPTASRNRGYSYQLTATGGAITWTMAGGSLPQGLRMSSTGLISGTPTQRGTFTFTVQATNGFGSALGTFKLQVH